MKSKAERSLIARLPFVLPCPSTPEALRQMILSLCAVLDSGDGDRVQLSTAALREVLRRILAAYSPHLRASNVGRLLRLLALLLLEMAPAPLHPSEDEEDAGEPDSRGAGTSSGPRVSAMLREPPRMANCAWMSSEYSEAAAPCIAALTAMPALRAGAVRVWWRALEGISGGAAGRDKGASEEPADGSDSDAESTDSDASDDGGVHGLRAALLGPVARQEDAAEVRAAHARQVFGRAAKGLARKRGKQSGSATAASKLSDEALAKLDAEVRDAVPVDLFQTTLPSLCMPAEYAEAVAVAAAKAASIVEKMPGADSTRAEQVARSICLACPHPRRMHQGHIRIMRLCLRVFPASDFQHVIATPAAAVLARAAASLASPGPAHAGERASAPGGMLPLSTPADAWACLKAAAAAQDAAVPARRAAPEAVHGVSSVLLAVTAAVFRAQDKEGRSAVSKKWTRSLGAALVSAPPAAGAVGDLPAADRCWGMWARGLREGRSDCAGLVCQAAQAAAASVVACKGRGHGPELLAPVLSALQLLTQLVDWSGGAVCGSRRAADLLAAAHKLARGMLRSERMNRGELRMQARRAAKPQQLAQLDPELEGDGMRAYNPGRLPRDATPAQREAVEVQKLRKELQREKRAVARELRQDSAFLAEEKDREQAARSAEQTVKYKEFLTFMQRQSTEANEAAREGLARGGGSGRAGNKARAPRIGSKGSYGGRGSGRTKAQRRKG